MDTGAATKNALLSTFRHATQIREPEAFRGWLYRTVRNACLISRRRKVGEPAHVLSLDAPSATGDGRPFDARVVGVSEDNVKTRLHRARLALRAALEAQ